MRPLTQRLLTAFMAGACILLSGACVDIGGTGPRFGSLPIGEIAGIYSMYSVAQNNYSCGLAPDGCVVTNTDREPTSLRITAGLLELQGDRTYRLTITTVRDTTPRTFGPFMGSYRQTGDRVTLSDSATPTRVFATGVINPVLTQDGHVWSEGFLQIAFPGTVVGVVATQTVSAGFTRPR